MVEVYTERLRNVRLGVYAWRRSLPIAGKLGLALTFAVLAGLLAQIKVPLPFSPVPITGQTFAALAAGVLLGRAFGGVSMAIYVTLGAAGIPWFNGGAGGPAAVFGPTGGYLIGFVVAALIIGYVTDRYPATRSYKNLFGLMLAVNFLVIHGLGLVWLGVWLGLIKGSAITLPALLMMGSVPFIVGDVVKAALAAAMGKTALPRGNHLNAA